MTRTCTERIYYREQSLDISRGLSTGERQGRGDMGTLMSSFEENPSSWLSSSNIVLCTSLSPAFSESNLLVPGYLNISSASHCLTKHSPMASNSSMKMMAGAFSLARAKASLTSLAPSPMNIWTN